MWLLRSRVQISSPTPSFIKTSGAITNNLVIIKSRAGVAELADATVLGAVEVTREGSSPFARTRIK